MTSRFALVVLVPMAFGLALAAPAWAGEEEDGPPFGASDLVLEETALPEGWEIVYDEVPGTPGEAAMESWASLAGRTSGIDEDDLLFETRVLKSPTGAHATVLLVEVDGDGTTMAKTVEQQAKGKGWTFRKLADPSRMLVVAAPADVLKPLLEIQYDYAVEILTKLAFERFETGGNLGANRFARSALAIEPKAAMPYAVLGRVAAGEEKWDDAIAAFRQAFDGKHTHPPTGRLAMWAWRTFGYALLQKKEKALDKEAVGAFEKAIGMEKEADRKKDMLFPAHYNLACAHARLGQVEPACRRLAKALEMAKDRLDEKQYRAYVTNHVLKDEDFELIKDTPQFKAVMEKAAGGAGGGDEAGL